MWNRNLHLSDQQLLMNLDGELSSREAKRALAHLEACWNCRARKQELETAIGDLVHAQQWQTDTTLPSGVGPRALLKAQISQLAARDSHTNLFSVPNRLAWLLAASSCGLLCLLIVLRITGSAQQRRPLIVSVPDSRLTPGAALLVNRRTVCAQTSAYNKAVPTSLAHKVFEEYGIVSASTRDYEVDYLITPALGGADDIHNLWPQSHAETVWNAEVKDELEQRLRTMVCEGQIELPEAQQEIAMNWIAAYKKYFHTDKPLSSK